jgi:hypothetical protein
MNKFAFFTVLLFSVFIFSSCEKDSGPQDQALEIDATLTEHSTFGWEINDLVKSGEDISGLTQSSEMLTAEYDNSISLQSMKIQGVQMVREAGSILRQGSYLAKTLSDSLYISYDDTLKGERCGMYYNSETGWATYYFVKYKFMDWRPLVYDSAAVVIDFNSTFEDSTDDRLTELYQQQLFKDFFFIQEITGELVITHYDGTEISGLEATKHTYYHANRFLQHLKQTVDLNPSQTGTLREDFEFRDNTTAYRSVTFNNDYTGTFSKQWRDGTQVSGSFNRVEDDLQGSFTELIDFPAGRYVDRIMKSAEVAIDTVEAIFSAEFIRYIYFSSGRIDTTEISLWSNLDEGLRTAILEVRKANGAHGIFTLVQSGSEGELTGTWTTWNEYLIQIEAEYYSDGSAHIHYEVFAPPPPYNLDDPILIADYDISPDGSGSGTITYQDEVYQVSFDGLDKAEISRGGKKARVNLYR